MKSFSYLNNNLIKIRKIKMMLFNILWINIKIFGFLILFLKTIYAQTLQNLKLFYLSNNKYYIITYENIIFYNHDTISQAFTVNFTDENKLTTVEGFERISMAKFKNRGDIADLVLVKNIIYAINEQVWFCNVPIDNTNEFYSKIFAFKCDDDNCYYIIGFITDNNELFLVLYKNEYRFCKNYHLNSYIINGVVSENLECHIMKSSSNEEIFACFYENNSKEIVAINFNIDIINNRIIPISDLIKSKPNNGAKIIKSVLSQNETKSYVCYINDNNNCDCLYYNSLTNEWNDYSTYLYGCLSTKNLFFDYYDISNQYFLYCYQSNSKVSILKLSENFEKKEIFEEDFFDLAQNCNNYFFSSLIYNTNDSLIFENCDNQIIKQNLGKYKNFTIKYTTIPSSLPNELNEISENSENPEISETSEKSEIINHYNNEIRQNVDLIIIGKKNFKTKEEIKEDIKEIIDMHDIGIIYEIYGYDYNIKISPINIKEHKNISTYIDFSTCENKLRSHYNLSQSDILTVFQMEINNTNEYYLTNKVEYVVYDEEKNLLDLTICSDEPIKIYYNIANSTALNISSIQKFANLGIDVFNIKDNFFHDICQPYSEGDSDLILKDRVNDIYQNYSFCDSNCEYENIDIQNMSIVCSCSIKTEIETELEEPTFHNIIFGIFEDSTFGVVKCYKLVFNLNKNYNIGFWMFLVFIILHIPFLINYIIFKDRAVKKYMKEEMIKYHYIDTFVNSKKKSKTIRVKDDSSKLNMNNNISNISIHKIKLRNKTKKIKKLNTMKISFDIDSISYLINNDTQKKNK